MLRLLRFTLAAAATVAAGLLVRRLLLQARGPAALPSAGQEVAEPPEVAEAPNEQPVGAEGAVSPRAVTTAARSLPGTREELYKEAARLGVRGRSRMNKRQLHEAVEAQSNGGGS
jgi:hypothetical protein